MSGKHEGMGATFYVTLIVLGLAALVGVIFWMMLAPSGIRHSPGGSSRLLPSPARMVAELQIGTAAAAQIRKSR